MSKPVKSNLTLQVSRSVHLKNVKSNISNIKIKSNTTIKINSTEKKPSQQETHYLEYKKRWYDILKQAKVDFHNAWENQDKKTKNLVFEDFQFIFELGNGSFGNVYLVKQFIKKVKKIPNEQSKGVDEVEERWYAVKVLKKENIFKAKQIEHTMNEKKLQSSIKFPFLVSLISSFKTNANLFMVFEYARGGDMFSHIIRLTRFSESTSRFYIAQVILAIEYLHALDILHRDLKPENTLICADGYLKLADFGFAKIVKTRTYTLCGTPQYLAPEIIKHQGYGKAADWWAIGILIYEMTVGEPPFNDPKDQNAMYEQILQADLKKTPGLRYLSEDLKDLLSHLIQIDLTKRYGNLKNGSTDVKLHRWFRKIDWQRIYEKKVEKPNQVKEIIKFINENDKKVTADIQLKQPVVKILESETVLYENTFESF